MTKRLGGRYELQTVIGGGGMAIVYKAVDTLLDRTVAVKMLRAQYAGDEEFVSRFRQEAQSAARLSHPNIVNLYDVGMSDGEYYIVMEYVDGPTLKDLVRERGPLPVHEALDITEQICDAIAHAHDHRIIHRDIKPHNILLTQRGQVKVTDFGIARAVTGNTITHHNDTSVLGSVHYFSPEQARGAAATEKSDIYSLGIVMYEMLTNQLPFTGDSPVSVALKHLRDEFVDPRELNPSIPQSVENVILRCMVKSPDLRYSDMAAVKADLKTALANPNVPKFVMADEVKQETLSIPAVGGLVDGLALEQTGSESNAKQARRPRKWWLSLMWIGIVMAVLAVGAGAAYYIVMDLVQVPNVNLPNVVGKPQATAMAMIEKAGIPKNQIHTQNAINSNQPKGYVYSQSPIGPQPVKQTRDVELYVSEGSRKILVPDLTGTPKDQATSTLNNDGFSNVTTNEVESATVPVGQVVSQTPAANSMVPSNTAIVLNISKGGQTTVPNVVGKTVAQATTDLQNAHLTVGHVTQIAFAAQNGTIVEIFPYSAGDKVPTGTAIDLWVANNAGSTGNSTSNSTGNSTSNSTSNSTGAASLDNLPPDTHVRPVTVKVSDPSGKPIQVQVVKSDAVAQNEQVVSQTITSDSTWNVTMYLTPNTQGEIKVYENGQLKQDRLIQY